MKGFSEIVCTVGFLIAGVAEAVNTFTNPGPGGNTVIQAGGGVTTITWQVDPAQSTISLILRSSNHPDFTLLDQQHNTGTFLWSVPELLPSGTYTFEIGAGPPDNLTGSSSSASFKIQPCKTCVSIPSTAKLPSATGDTLVTAMSRVSATGTVETKTGSASEGSTLSESGSISTGHSGTEEATLSGSASPSKSTSISAAETLFPIAMEKWMVIPLMIVGMFLYPMLAI